MINDGGMMNGLTENEFHFQPLFRALRRLELTGPEWDEAIANYMFMFVEDGLYAYKHRWTRQYAHLDEAGVIQGGNLNTGNFPSPSPSVEND